jgi:proline iminopeptidase
MRRLPPLSAITAIASIASITLLTSFAGLLAVACSPHPSTVAPASTKAGAGSEATPVALKTTEWIQPAGDVQLSAHARGGRDGGPALIVLHGGPGLSHEYTRPIEGLATAELRVIGFDQRGVGRSTPPPISAFGLEHHVDDVEVLRRGQSVERVHLLGHSWGGLVAMGYAAKYPAHVASLVLVDSVAPTRALWRAAQDRFAAREKQLVAEGLVPALLPPPNGPDCSPRMLAMLPVYYADPRHSATKDLGGSRCHTGIFEITMLATGDWDFSAALRALPADVDTLVVQGAADPFGVEPADAIAGAAPRASKTILPACGHLPWEECEAPFFAAVRAFLDAHVKR